MTTEVKGHSYGGVVGEVAPTLSSPARDLEERCKLLGTPFLGE